MKERDNKANDIHISGKVDKKKMDTMEIQKNIAAKDDKKVEQTNKIAEVKEPNFAKETKNKKVGNKDQESQPRKTERFGHPTRWRPFWFPYL